MLSGPCCQELFRQTAQQSIFPLTQLDHHTLQALQRVLIRFIAEISHLLVVHSLARRANRGIAPFDLCPFGAIAVFCMHCRSRRFHLCGSNLFAHEALLCYRTQPAIIAFHLCSMPRHHCTLPSCPHGGFLFASRDTFVTVYLEAHCSMAMSELLTH